jgi:hypothetical protein
MKTADMIATLDAWHTTLETALKLELTDHDALAELKDEISALADRFRDGETVS